MMKKYYYVIVGIVVLLFVVLFLKTTSSKLELVHDFSGNMTVYKSSSCGCCTLYYKYYQSQGNDNVESVTFDLQGELDSFKDSLGIPLSLRSCHTTVVGDYFVEGHVPLDVIEKLLKDAPDILGIAIPGMPEGSPGMPGSKRDDFVVYAVNRDGTYQEYMRY